MDKPEQLSPKAASKFLSYILRHHPEAVGVELDREGWTDIDMLLVQTALHGRPISRDLLQTVVETNNKKRFTLSPCGKRIRAAQGHSTPQVVISHTPQCPPDVLYHGTAAAFLDAIRQQGLLAGQRHHVHLSADVQTARQVGMRHGKPCVLTVDAAQMHAAGFEFYLSDNGVWLTESVPVRFLDFQAA